MFAFLVGVSRLARAEVRGDVVGASQQPMVGMEYRVAREGSR